MFAVALADDLKSSISIGRGEAFDMPAIRCLLDEYLKAAGVAKPDGRLLYQYPIADTPDAAARMASLVDVLKKRLITEESLDLYECAAFCFALARKGVPVMADAALTWNGLLISALGLIKDDIPAVHSLQAYTDSGLGWWERRLIRVPTSVRYLSSLWCEGGGPLNWILRDFGAFRSFFREVLRVHAEYPTRDLDWVICEEQYRLPGTLQHAPVLDMTREAVRETVRLRERLQGVGGVTQQLQWLDENEPGWRNRWPFPLEDELALELVRGAVGEPPAAARDHDTIGIEVTLEPAASNGLVLKRSLVLPKLLNENRVAEVSGTPRDDLPPQQWWKLVVACREYDVAKLYRPTPAAPFTVAAAGHAAVTGQAAAQRATLLCRRGAREVFSTSDLPGNDSLPEGLWVFEEYPAGKPARFVGGGSYSTANESLILVVPTGTPMADSPDLKNIGVVVDTQPLRNAFRLTGALVMPSEDGTVTLSVKNQSATSLRFSLTGQSRTLGAHGSDVWLGLPLLCECDADGSLRRIVPDKEVQWRANGEAEWQQVTNRDDCLGDMRIRFVSQDKGVVFRQRITVFPKQTQISFRGGDIPLTGKVHLRNLAVAAADISPGAVDVGRHIEVEGQGTLVSITIRDDDRRERPPTFRCRISWGHQRYAEVAIGVPVHDVVISDVAGRRCMPPGPIPVGLLDGLSLRATFPNQCEPVIVDTDGDIWASLIPDGVGSTTFALPLSAIANRARGYLAMSDQIDGFLSLYIRRESHNAQQQTVVRITHTAGQVLVAEDTARREHVTLTVPEALRKLPWLSRQRTFQLRRLTDCEEPVSADAVQQLDDATWSVDKSLLPAEGVLAVVRGSGGVCLSPRYLSRQSAAPPMPLPLPEQLRFVDVVRIDNEQERFAACGQLLNALTLELSSPEWECIDRLLDQSMDLPAPTFNFISAIAGQPLVAALCALRVAGREPRFWAFLEQLKFLWSMVPIATWLHAIRLYKAHLEDTAHGSTGDVLGAFCFSACRAALCMHPVVSLMSSNYTDIAFKRGPSAGDLGDLGIETFDANEAKSGVQKMFARLCGEHKGEKWPAEAVAVGPRTQEAIDFFALHDITGYTQAVVYAPIQAAARMAHGVPTTPQEIVRLIRCRAFDTEWYDSLQQLMTYYLVSQRLADRPNAYHAQNP